MVHRYSEAWNLCSVIDSKECWLKLAISALTTLNIEKGNSDYISDDLLENSKVG